jgi:ribosomal protein S11
VYKLKKLKKFKFSIQSLRKIKRKLKRKLKLKKKLKLLLKLKKKLRIAFLIYRKTHSNYFLTLTDRNFSVITCVTSGNSRVGDSKRKKISPYAMEKLGARLVLFLALYKIKALNILVYTKPTAAFFTLTQQLTFKHIKIRRIQEKIHIPHNGIRQRKVRRK